MSFLKSLFNFFGLNVVPPDMADAFIIPLNLNPPHSPVLD
jgi:hypothetical protein